MALIGYARVSTDIQETDLQMDALKRAKCVRVYEEKASGAKADRPELMKLLDTLTPLSVTEAKRFLDEHGERLNALLEPRRVRGLVLEVATPEAQAVLHELGHDDALVLEQGKTPDTSNEKLQLAAAGVLVALAVAVMLVRAPA